MKIKHIANIKTGQDGAIYKDYLFRFDGRGNGRIYSLLDIDFSSEEPIELNQISSVTLDRREEIVPHSNAVFFGTEYAVEGDEFPLLYSNIYNNYAKAEDKLCGVTCVYRLTREGNEFSTELYGLIEIGFTDDRELWRSPGDTADVRPYGNFVADNENGKYYAFVMRDGVKETRYFRFAMPKLSEWVLDEKFGVRKAVLGASDIEEYFDVPYHNYIQGAILRNGKIYEVEGFHATIRPAIRVIDTEKKCQELFFDFFEAGYEEEPEFIDFYGEKCIYSDGRGNVFLLEL